MCAYVIIYIILNCTAEVLIVYICKPGGHWTKCVESRFEIFDFGLLPRSDDLLAGGQELGLESRGIELPDLKTRHAPVRNVLQTRNIGIEAGAAHREEGMIHEVGRIDLPATKNIHSQHIAAVRSDSRSAERPPIQNIHTYIHTHIYISYHISVIYQIMYHIIYHIIIIIYIYI